MLLLNKRVQGQIFTSEEFYIQTLEDILDCLVKQELYEKAAEVRDLIIYERIKNSELKKIYRKDFIEKYKK